MMKGYDVYLCTCSIEELLDYIQTRHIEIYEINTHQKILFSSILKYRKILYEHPQIHYLYTKGIIGMFFRFFLSKEKILSFLLSFCLLFIFNHTIFQVEYYGESQKHLMMIQNQLKNYQIPFLMFHSKNMLTEMKKLNEHFNWYSIIQKGSKLEIHYLPRKTFTLSQNHPYDLIATSDGVIASFDVSKGNKVVKVNQKVKVGDVLVSHILIDSKNEEKTMDVLGKVYAFTFKKVDIEIKKDKLPLGVQYYKCLLLSRMTIQLDQDEKIVKEIPLQFYEEFDKIKMSNYYVLYEMIAGVGESYE